MYRVGQWVEYMEGHERWRDQIWAAMSRAGVQEVTCTPEHGPPNYQVEISLVVWWDVCVRGMFLEGMFSARKRFSRG